MPSLRRHRPVPDGYTRREGGAGTRLRHGSEAGSHLPLCFPTASRSRYSRRAGVRPVTRKPERTWYYARMMKSVRAVLWGNLLALGIGALVVFGIVWPVFEFFFGSGIASTSLPVVVVVCASAFSYFWGGMLASYKAPSHRRLHGVLVGMTAFLISPAVNLISSVTSARASDPFANLRTPGALMLTAVLLVVVFTASYIGARRGEVLHAHNQTVIRKQKSRKARERLSDEES